MFTRRLCRLVVLWSLGALAACTASPTGPDIEETLARQTEDELRSAAGPWWGLASGGSVRLEFALTQTPTGTLQGTGTMRDARAGNTVPISVSGTYLRPDLGLTFAGMVYDGRAVLGTFAGAYSSFSGVSGTLRLTAEGYAESLSLLLQEGTAPPASLGGRVTDAVTGTPVVGATLSVQGRSVISSPTGHYGFDPNLAAGRFPVTVIHPLYVDVVQEVEIAPYRIVDFKLQPK